jgi:anti-sigma factor RsiW
MKPIEPAEISALLDGELSGQRADEVRRAIAEDESLGQVYEQLAALDGDLKACAAQAAFRPRVSIKAPSPLGVHVLVMAVLMLLVRLTVRLLPFGLAEVLELAVLALVVGWVLTGLLRAAEEDRRRLAGSTATDPA